MASLSGEFNFYATTDAGAPLASGRVYTYTAGTTTKKTAYTDAAGSVAHTYVSDGAGGEYIALNSRGELPAPLFLTSGAYDITLKTSAGVTVWTRRASGVVAETVSITEYGGAASASGATNSAALAAAEAAVNTAGGGVITIPAGTFTFANVGAGSAGGSGASSWDNRYCFRFTHNNITIRGAGRGVTILKVGNGENAHMLQFGQRAGASVSVSNCGVEDLEINGNRANQTTPDDTLNHWDCINVSTGCTGIRLRNLYLHDAPHYGIGFQRDGFHHCLVEYIDIQNCGGDGIDCKDDSDAGTGNVARHIKVRNWGLNTALTTGQAAVDLRSGWTAYDIDIASPGGADALNGIRLQNGVAGATPVQPTRVHNFRAAGSDTATSVGVRVITRYGAVSDGYVKAWADGYSLSDPDSRLSKLIAEANETGFRLWQNSGAGVEADTATLSGLVARSNTQNGVVCDSVDEVTLMGCDVRNNTTTGYDIRSGCTNVRILGGSCTGNGTNLSDSGTGTVVQGVSGVRTKSAVAGSAAIDSTGTKTVTIAHTLDVTPSIDDVSLSLKRNTNVGDWSAGFLWVSAVDATNITAQLRVLTASATVGAVVDVLATVEAKSRF